jgi:Ni/Co efflux regulator RcnB
MNVGPSISSARMRHSSSQGSIFGPFSKETEMKKFLAIAGVATMLLAAVPLAAEAAPYNNHGQQQSRNYHAGPSHSRPAVHHQQVRRDFNHWRPGLERSHYRSFSNPVYSNGYYRVRARDNHNRLVLLTISAITGAIIASSY